MNNLLATLALLLPWAGTAFWVRRALPAAAPGAWPMALGYGLLLGLLATTLLMRFWSLSGLGLQPWPTLLSWAVIGLLGGWLVRRAGMLSLPERRRGATARPQAWRAALAVLLCGLILLRLGSLGLELYWRPLYPWDAWTIWLLRAEIWAQHGSLVEFVESAQWLQGHDPDIYTADAWRYPKTVSLIAAWMMLNSGAEHEGWWHLPWLLALSACALGLYGQVRCWGGSRLAALLVVYLLVSLPLLGTHVALAGYADIWVAATLGLGGVALWRWLILREQGWLALLVLAFLPLLKFEGAVWLLIFVPAALAVRLRPAGFGIVAALSVVAAVVWWRSGGLNLDVPLLGMLEFGPERIRIGELGSFSLGYEPAALAALAKGLLVMANWHLLGFAALIVLVGGVLLAWRERAVWASTLSLLAAAALLAMLFLFTHAAEWAIIQTSSNRLMLHFAPLLVFHAWLVWQAVHRAGLIDRIGHPAGQSDR